MLARWRPVRVLHGHACPTTTRHPLRLAERKPARPGPGHACATVQERRSQQDLNIGPGGTCDGVVLMTQRGRIGSSWPTSSVQAQSWSSCCLSWERSCGVGCAGGKSPIRRPAPFSGGTERCVRSAPGGEVPLPMGFGLSGVRGPKSRPTEGVSSDRSGRGRVGL